MRIFKELDLVPFLVRNFSPLRGCEGARAIAIGEGEICYTLILLENWQSANFTYYKKYEGFLFRFWV